MKSQLFDVKALASSLDCSVRTAWRLRDSGRLPAPAKVGRLVRWRAEDIDQWVRAGCPDVRKSGWTTETND